MPVIYDTLTPDQLAEHKRLMNQKQTEWPPGLITWMQRFVAVNGWCYESAWEAVAEWIVLQELALPPEPPYDVIHWHDSRANDIQLRKLVTKREATILFHARVIFECKMYEHRLDNERVWHIWDYGKPLPEWEWLGQMMPRMAQEGP